MICKKCKSELPDNAERCPVCGMPLLNVGYAGYQDDPFPAYDDPAAAPPPDNQGYDEYGYERESEGYPIEPQYEQPEESRRRRAIYREDEEEEAPEETDEPRPAPNFSDPPTKFEPYVVPPEEPSPFIEAATGLPSFLRALIFEPRTTLNTMLDRADMWSGALTALAALIIGLFACIGLGTGAMRVHPATDSGLGFALLIFLRFAGVGTVIGAGLIALIIQTLGTMIYLGVFAKVRITLTLITATLAYALTPTLVLGLPILIFSMFSPLAAYCLTACGAVWSLINMRLIMQETPDEYDDRAYMRSLIATLTEALVAMLLIAAFGG